jgi:xanthine permease
MAAQGNVARAVHPVDAVLPVGHLFAYGLQHVLAFYAGAVLVPIIIAGALKLDRVDLIHLINADLITCGIASLIQSVGFWKIGVRLPLVQGVTFTAVGPMIAIGVAAGGGTEGLRAIYGAVIVAGVAAFLVAGLFSRLLKFFPPVVTGTVILTIGLALIPVAASDVVLGQGPDAIQNPVAGGNLLYAFGTLALIVAIQRIFRGFLVTVAVLIGLVAGTLVAWALGDAQFADAASAPWLGATTPFAFGLPSFGLSPILSMLVVLLITMVETTGDVYATGEIVGKRIVPEDITRAIRADGVATLLGGILNSFPYTCFAENVGLIRLTQVKSRWVVAAAGIIMILLGVLPKAAAIVAAIPLPVLGGAALAMFATVAVVGVQTLGKVDFNNHNNIVIVATSLGLGMLVTAQPFVADAFPSWAHIIFGSGITVGSLSAIGLNALFNHTDWRSTAIAGRPEAGLITLSDINALDEAGFARVFGGLVQHTPWILARAAAMRPFADTAALRAAFHDALLTGERDEQLHLMNRFPDLGTEAADGEDLRQLGAAYRTKFGFPLIICAHDMVMTDRLLPGLWNRLANSPRVEMSAGLVEIARIVNDRLDELVADANPIISAQFKRLQTDS